MEDLYALGTKSKRDVEDVKGNALANVYADVGRQLHGYEEEDVSIMKDAVAKQKYILKLMVQILDSWPYTRQLWGDVSKLPKMVVQGNVTARQEWELIVETPHNVPERLIKTKWGEGHTLIVFGDGEVLDAIACRRCGARALERARNLRAKCKGKPSSNHTADVVKKLREGVHPLTKRKLERVEILRIPEEQE